MVTGRDVYCEHCPHDVDYHDPNGCGMGGCRCKIPGLSYDEELAKIRVIDEEIAKTEE